MFDESNLAELGLNVSEPTTNGGQSFCRAHLGANIHLDYRRLLLESRASSASGSSKEVITRQKHHQNVNYHKDNEADVAPVELMNFEEDINVQLLIHRCVCAHWLTWSQTLGSVP